MAARVAAVATALVVLVVVRRPWGNAPGRQQAERLRRLLAPAHGRERRQDKQTPPSPLLRYPAALERAFNLADEVRWRKVCNLNNLRWRPRDAVGLSVARAASETVHARLKGQGAPSVHRHECALADYARAGARRVVVSLRDPVARLVSGFQRRVEGNNARHADNAAFVAHFETLDAYVDALLDADDASHGAALNVTYGGTRQNFMLPVEEFYLDLDRVPAGAAPRDADVVDVRYACVESLDADLARILDAWRVNITDASYVMADHHSAKRSDSAAAQHAIISDANAARIRRLYANDAALHARFCRARSADGELFRAPAGSKGRS